MKNQFFRKAIERKKQENDKNITLDILPEKIRPVAPKK